MDPEGQGGAPVGGGQQSTTTAGGQAAPNHGFGAAPKVMDSSFAQFKEHPSFNFPVALTWVAAVLSVTATLFFWWINRNLTDSLSEKTTERDNIKQQILNQGDIEKKANDFKLSVEQLKIAYTEKYDFSAFTAELYKKITNDVTLESLAITADGSVSMSGNTKSYRSVADLMVALKSWDNLQDIELLSSAINETEDGGVITVFSLSAKIDKTKQQAAKNNISSVIDFNDITGEGGSDAKI